MIFKKMSLSQVAFSLGPPTSSLTVLPPAPSLSFLLFPNCPSSLSHLLFSSLSLFHPDDPWLAPLFAYVTLRLFEPAIDLSSSGWTDEPLKDALGRAVSLLHMRAIGGLKGWLDPVVVSSDTSWF